jgi:hypothetical protein
MMKEKLQKLDLKAKNLVDVQFTLAKPANDNKPPGLEAISEKHPDLVRVFLFIYFNVHYNWTSTNISSLHPTAL